MDKVKTAFLAALQTAWAIRPDMLSIILAVAAGEQELPQALQTKTGQELEGTRTITTRGNVAVLPITGPIFPRANLFSEISGATSLQRLALDLQTAVENPAVDAVMLEIDSPGGALPGVEDFAKEVQAARQKKPVVAYVYHEAASAAYWIAAAAEEIILPETGIVGSIGVVLGMRKPDDPATSRSVEFVSSVSPNKRPKIDSEPGRAQVQSFVDKLGLVFVQSIAAYRQMDAADVIAIGGGLLIGDDAVRAGLADRVGTFEQALASLQQSARGRGYQAANAPGASSEATTMKFSETSMGKALAGLLGQEVPKAEETAANKAADQLAVNAPPAAPTVNNDAIAQLQAQLEAEVHARLTGEAKAFASSLFAQHKKLPFELSVVEAEYLQAAQDDRALPVTAGQKSRVDRLRERYAAAPVHQLTQERTAATALPQGAQVLAAEEPEAEVKAAEETEESTRAWVKATNRRNGTGK